MGKVKESEVLKKIDWSDLRAQKTVLLQVIRFFGRVKFNAKTDENPRIIEGLDGILNLIDTLQDFAVNKMGIHSIHIYDFEEEERREASTPAENFARESAEKIFDELCESDSFHVENDMSVEFISDIMASRYHSVIIKAKIRGQILNDLKVYPKTFKYNADDNPEYDSDMRSDYEGLVTTYIREQAKTLRQML